jgi:TFIIF-interacting CTD phosphatase-like protein
LVLDLDETLVHYFENGSQGMFNVRPGVDEFLTEMNKHYEVVIFTAAMQDVR